jgi:predicted dehydrogenase
MNFLVIGLGSMGKRRIRNLIALGVPKSDIYGFDIKEERKKEAWEKYGINVVNNPDEVINLIDCIIISTPPDRHLEYQKYSVDKNKHFFCEAGIFKEGLDEILKKAEAKDIKAIASKTPIMFGERKIIKKLITEKYVGEPISFYYHSGNFLPYWHKYEDFRNFYASQRETGGAREIVVFQMSWLRWVFGEVSEVFCSSAKLSPDFASDINDIYSVFCVFGSKIFGNIIVDVIARPYIDLIEITCRNGLIFFNFAYDNTVKVKKNGEEKWQEFNIGLETPEKGYLRGEEAYIEEIKDFIDCVISGNDYGYDYRHEIKSIDVLAAAEKSVKGRRVIKL